MPIIGSSPWTDAANFGQGVGQALSEGLLQLPMQRYALARQNALMQENLLRNEQLNQYRQGLLGLRQGQIGDMAQYHQMALENAQLLNQIRAAAQQETARYHQSLENKPTVLAPGATVVYPQGIPQGLQGGGGNTFTAPARQPSPLTQYQTGELLGLGTKYQMYPYVYTNLPPNVKSNLTDVGNRIMGLVGPQTNPTTQTTPNITNGPTRVRNRSTGEIFDYFGNASDIPTNQFDIVQ